MENDRKNRPVTAAVYIFCLCAALCMLSVCPRGAAGSRTGTPDPEPVIEMTGFHGPFDAMALFRYYSMADMPSGPGLKDERIEYGGRTYRLESVGGPVDTKYGACWEVMYMEVEK